MCEHAMKAVPFHLMLPNRSVQKLFLQTVPDDLLDQVADDVVGPAHWLISLALESQNTLRPLPRRQGKSSRCSGDFSTRRRSGINDDGRRPTFEARRAGVRRSKFKCKENDTGERRPTSSTGTLRLCE